jgi:hypothetical protein
MTTGRINQVTVIPITYPGGTKTGTGVKAELR